MYIVFEYLTYLTLVALLGLVLFAASVTLLLSREGAKILAATSRRAATQLIDLASKHVSAVCGLRLQRSHQGQ
jgi:hypothetical protein